jgi:hypothetical protein
MEKVKNFIKNLYFSKLRLKVKLIIYFLFLIEKYV